MGTYFVRLFSETLASIEGRESQLLNDQPEAWKFEFESAEIGLYDYTTQKSGTRVHCGLCLDCWVTASSIEEAANAAKSYAETMLSWLSYQSQASIMPCDVLIIYDADKGDKESRQFRQAFPTIKSQHGHLREIDEDDFGRILTQVRNQDKRVQRALNLGRRALNEDNTVDEFLLRWMALDSLTQLLINKQGLQRENRYPSCPQCEKLLQICSHCGKDTGKPQASNMYGLKAFFRKEFSISGKEFEKYWYKYRNLVFHGEKPLTPDLVAELSVHNTTLRSILNAAIGYLIDLPNEIIRNINSQEPRKGTHRLVPGIDANLKDFTPPDLSEINSHPYAVIEEETYDVNPTPDGNLNIQNKTRFRFYNANFETTYRGVFGDSSTGIKPDEITFNEPDEERSENE